MIIEKPRIIDFGVVWSPDTVTYENMNDQLRIYDPSHDQESVEHSFWNGKTNTKYTDEYLIDDILNKKPILEVLQNTLGVPFSTLQKQLTNFATSSSVVRNVDTYNFFKLYWSKFDAWSFGAILATLFQIGIFDPDFKRKVYDPHRVKIISVCKGLLHLDPAYRLDAIEALSLWAPESPVLKEPAIAKWLSSQTALRVKTASVSGSEFAYV